MTYAVFFDVLPKQGFADAYFGMAGGLKPIVEKNPGFLSVERFESLDKPGWYLSFSQWVDENALSSWRCQHDHHEAQVCGRNIVLEDYRLRVGSSVSKSMETAISSKLFVAVMVGDFSLIKQNAGKVGANFGESARVFKGVINKKRGIALMDLSFSDALAMYRSMTDDELFASELYQIERDYGMFDRVQAPGAFS